jgi:hypothetical protein
VTATSSSALGDTVQGMTADTPPAATEPPLQPDAVTGGHVVQVVMHGAMFPAFRDWLDSHGLVIAPFPSVQDDLPTFMVAVSPERMGREPWPS